MSRRRQELEDNMRKGDHLVMMPQARTGQSKKAVYRIIAEDRLRHGPLRDRFHRRPADKKLLLIL
jgi:hypothetical protein